MSDTSSEIPENVQNRRWINSYSVFVQARCDGNLMKFYTTLSSSSRSNIWIIFPQKISRFLFFFFFFFLLYQRDIADIFRTNKRHDRTRVSRITYRSGGDERERNRVAGRDKCTTIVRKNRRKVFLPSGFRRRNDSSVWRGTARRHPSNTLNQIERSFGRRRRGRGCRVTKQLKRRINCDRTPGKISP